MSNRLAHVDSVKEARDKPLWRSVLDPGIYDSEQALIFKKFYRGRNHRQAVEGTGMGLPIARAIINLYGGSLCVKSERGQGGIFSFTLPVDS
jgi:signal transduction histidine kinase